MLSPSTIMAETDKLGALIEVLSNPDKYKKQIAEMRQLSEDTDKKLEQLAQERVEFQNIVEEAHIAVAQADKAVAELENVMLKAGDVVNGAVIYHNDANVRAVEVIREAKELLMKMEKAGETQAQLFRDEVDLQTDRLADLTKAADAEEKRLKEATAKLEELRRSL